MNENEKQSSCNIKQNDEIHFDSDQFKHKYGENVLKCFVIMPFGSKDEYDRKNIESDYVFNNVICPSVEMSEKLLGKKIIVAREVDKNLSGSITKSILRNIATADICIVDITGRNPNVFFELGIRYSLKNKITILMRQERTEIPFDIQGYRCLSYDCLKPNRAILELSEYLVAGLNDSANNDSLVFETFPEMEVHIPNVLTSYRKTTSLSILPWDDWWKRILELKKLLKEPFDNGRFGPAAIFGISNGGLVVADFLGREVFSRVPILSLWANRWLDATAKAGKDQSCYYFDNEYNKATLQPLKALYSENQNSFSVLLIDDLVYTSNTISQASIYMKKELGENCKILFTPMFCRNTEYLNSIKEILPFDFENGSIFNISKDDYFKQVQSPRKSFPYMKDLGGFE
jgi:hypoxanthine phosphoribosyltransferase